MNNANIGNVSEVDMVKKHLDQSLGHFHTLSISVRVVLFVLATVIVVTVLGTLILIWITVTSDAPLSVQIDMGLLEVATTLASTVIWKLFGPTLDRFKEEIGKFERSIMQLFAIERSKHPEMHMAMAVAFTNAENDKQRGEIAVGFAERVGSMN